MRHGQVSEEAATSIDGLNTSASARKIPTQFILGSSKERADSVSSYRVIDLELLFECFAEVGCKQYGDLSLIVKDKKH